jgi:ATP-dependent Clp protease ATP-binding subunit ClpA
MLSRLTPGVRAVVTRAYGSAQRDGSPQIGDDHLLWALLDDEQGQVLLSGVGGAPDRAELAEEMEQARRRGGVTAGEAEALAGYGIDVDAVVGQIEQHLGAGALAGSGPSSVRHWTGPAMSGPAVRALAEAQRHLGLAGGRSLGVEHLVLGLVSTPGFVSESLARRGITAATVAASLAAAQRGGAAR